MFHFTVFFKCLHLTDHGAQLNHDLTSNRFHFDNSRLANRQLGHSISYTTTFLPVSSKRVTEIDKNSGQLLCYFISS